MPAGFVDHRKTLIFIDHIQRNVFRKSLQRRQLDLAGDNNFFTAAQPHGSFRHIAFDQNFVLFHQLLHADAAYVRQLRHQPLVKTLASGVSGNGRMFEWSASQARNGL